MCHHLCQSLWATNQNWIVDCEVCALWWRSLYPLQIPGSWTTSINQTHFQFDFYLLELNSNTLNWVPTQHWSKPICALFGKLYFIQCTVLLYRAILLLLISNNKVRLTHLLDVTINCKLEFFVVGKAKFCSQMYP